MCYNDKKVKIVNTVKQMLNKNLDLSTVYVKSVKYYFKIYGQQIKKINTIFG